MVRFSCFQAHIHSHKQKKTVRLSSETHTSLEDASQNQVLRNSSYSAVENKSYFKENGDILYNNDADNAIDSSPTERDYRSEEIESKCNTDCGKNLKMKKSLSLGSGLNWKERTSALIGSEDEMEQRFSYDESGNCSGVGAQDGINDQGVSVPDQFQEPVPSDSVQVNCDFAKEGSIFSIGDIHEPEKEGADKDDIHFSGAGDSGNGTPRTPPICVKSSSLPSIGSPKSFSASLLPRSRSAEDVNALESRKKGLTHGGEKHIEREERDCFTSNDDKNNDENPGDDTYDSYNYVGSAKDWIIPEGAAVDADKSTEGETSFQNWTDMSATDFKLKRIQDWVINLQHCGPLEDSECTPSDDQELPKDNALSHEQATEKLEVKVSPGMEAAKRYISSLNASATAAQLTNLGLVVIPFLSAFGSLKALNLSGNAIVRITAGALPRGLHILNLSKNNISTIEGLRDLARLRVLDLSYNRIMRIGHGLASCSSIKELYLAGNKISEVEGLHRLLKLNVLDLRFNKITTTKCLGQLAANYNCLQALSLEGNPAQKNVGDEQLKKYVQSLLPNLTYYNRQSVKVGSTKDTADRTTRLGIGAHQLDRGLRVEAKTTRKGTHGIVAQKVPSSSIHGRKSQAVVSQKQSRSKHARVPPSGMKTTTQVHQVAGLSNKLLTLKNDFFMRRSQSEGTLGVL